MQGLCVKRLYVNFVCEVSVCKDIVWSVSDVIACYVLVCVVCVCVCHSVVCVCVCCMCVTDAAGGGGENNTPHKDAAKNANRDIAPEFFFLIPNKVFPLRSGYTFPCIPVKISEVFIAPQENGMNFSLFYFAQVPFLNL